VLAVLRGNAIMRGPNSQPGSMLLGEFAMAKIAFVSGAGAVKIPGYVVASFRSTFREVRQLRTAGTASDAYDDDHRYIRASAAYPCHDVE
jgi:hypothetical protein